MFDSSVRKIDNISNSIPQDNAFPSKVAMHDSSFINETKSLVDDYHVIIKESVTRKKQRTINLSEVWDVFYSGAHVLHDQCFEMLKAKKIT